MAATSRRPRGRTPSAKQADAKRARSKAAPVARESSAAIVQAALGAFAHEVRTPLTGILAISDLLATSGLGPREQQWIETIKAGAEHLAALATVFVDAAGGKAGLGTRQQFFDLRALARAAGGSLTGRATAKGLAAKVDIARTLPAFAIGDNVGLRAALENLIDNAVKFTAQGGVSLKVGARAAQGGKIAVTCVVADRGIGLTLTEVKRLFRPFSQANVSIAGRFGGAGLGLHSVRQVARAMGGDVTVKARAGGGAIFTLTAVLARAAAPFDDVASGPVSHEDNALRILCVEDNPFGRVVLNTVLTELGHRADFVERGEDALTRLATGGYDVVMMDMVLPGIGGVEAIRRIRLMKPAEGRIAIIGLSGRDDDERAAREAGADAFLVKPVSPRGLAVALAVASRLLRAAT